MDVGEWQARLSEEFSENGVIGGSELLPISVAEHSHSRLVAQRYKGHYALHDSFSAFFSQTLSKTTEPRDKFAAQGPSWYPSLVLRFTTAFRGLRAAALLALNGYPLNGHALLREPKDGALFIAALASGETDLRRLGGHRSDHRISPEMNEREFAQLVERRKTEERRVLGKMVRRDSGLPDEHIQHLRRWEQLFNLEIHGSRFTESLEGSSWMARSGPLPLQPVHNQRTMAMYFCRVDEVSWMWLRSLPLLQDRGAAFGPEWTHKWNILDDSFRASVQGLSDLGKPIADVFVAMLDCKFPFHPDITYYREDHDDDS